MAYRKDDIPKVKLDFPKIDLSGIDFTMENMNTIFDNIAKDIRERQDNVIAMEFTKCIVELLRKNGVIPKITEYTRENVKENSIEQLYGISIDELDFSEHDKVFEDKIAELKKDYKTASELLGKYQQENESLKQRIDELEKELSSVVKEAERQEFIRDMSCLERQELKQRIAELESKKIVDLPFDPLDTANYLINATYERETNGIERAFQNLPEKVNSDRYTVDELEQIAEHLLIYCRHNKE